MARRVTQQTAFRLTPTARAILTRIADQDGQTNTAIVEWLIREEGKRRHISTTVADDATTDNTTDNSDHRQA